MLGPLLLIVMLWRVGPEKCWSAVSGADFFWFLAACLLSLPSIAAAYWFRHSFAETLHISGAEWWLVMAITTLAASAMYFASAYCCAKAIGLSLGIVDVVAGSSVVAVLALLPVSVAGIGTRDAAFVAIFAHCGIDAGQSIAFSSPILAWMLVNCVFFLIVSRLPNAKSTIRKFIYNLME